VPGAISIPTAQVPSPKLVACGPLDGSGVQVPHPSESKALSVATTVTMAGPTASFLAMMFERSPPNPLKRAQ